MKTSKKYLEAKTQWGPTHELKMLKIDKKSKSNDYYQ